MKFSLSSLKLGTCFIGTLMFLALGSIASVQAYTQANLQTAQDGTIEAIPLEVTSTLC